MPSNPTNGCYLHRDYQLTREVVGERNLVELFLDINRDLLERVFSSEEIQQRIQELRTATKQYTKSELSRLLFSEMSSLIESALSLYTDKKIVAAAVKVFLTERLVAQTRSGAIGALAAPEA